MNIYQRLALLPPGMAPPATIDPIDQWWLARGVRPITLVEAKRSTQPGTYAIDCLMDARGKKSHGAPIVCDIEPDGAWAGLDLSLCPQYIHALRNVATAHPSVGAGVYNLPPYERAPGYEPHRISWTNFNNIMRDAGVFAAMAALFPSCYAMCETEVNGQPGPVDPAYQYLVVTEHVRECNRVAPGKPVYVFFCTTLRSTGGKTWSIDCPADCFDATIRAAKDAGAAGVVLWSGVKGPPERPTPDPLHGLTQMTGREPWLAVVLEAAARGALMAVSTVTGNLSFTTTTGYNAQDLTIEGWVYLRTVGSNYAINLETVTNPIGLTLRFTSSGAGWELNGTQSYGGGATDFVNVATSGGSPAGLLHTWTHVAAVFPNGWVANTSLAKLYINGAAATITPSASAGTATTLSGTVTLFNRASGASRQMDGLLHRLRVWKRALSAGEVAQAYAAATDAETAALSFASSLALEFKGEANRNITEYSGYPEGATLTPTVSGTVTAAPLTRYPRQLKMAALWRASDGAYSDTGLTTLISANTASNGSTGGVYGIKDLTGCGNNATQSTTNKVGDWFTNGASVQAITANLGDYNVAYNLATASKFNARSFSMWMVGRWTRLTEQGHSLYGTSAADIIVQCESDGRLSGSNNSANIHGCDSLSVFVWVFTASGITIYRDGVPATASAAAAATGLTGGNLLANGVGTEYFDGWLCEAGIYQDTQLTLAEAQALTTALMTAYGITPKTRKCVMDGTSSMLGASATYKQNRAWLLNNTAGLASVRFFNCAMSGESLASMEADIAVPGNIRTREMTLEPGQPVKLWVQGGANDGAVGATALTALDSYITAAKAQGFADSDIMLQCILPASAASLNGNQTESGIFNAGIRTRPYRFIDSTGDSGWQWANYSSAGYYEAANIHLNDAGFARENSGYIAPGLGQWMGGNRARLVAALEG